MTNLQYNLPVDINVFPDIDPVNVAENGAKFTMGDLHGNALKLMYMLVRHGVMKVTKSDYEAFVEIYYTSPEALTKAQLVTFNSILSSAEINASAAINLVGDVVCDRGQNDYFTLKILKKLHDNNVATSIEYSNHDADFITAYEKQDQFYPAMLQHFGISMSNMQRLIERNLVSREEVIDMINTAYKPCLKLIDYTLSDDNNEISISTHAAVGLKNIKFIANKLGVVYDDASAKSLAQTIDRINQKFVSDFVATNKISDLVDQGMLNYAFNGMNYDIRQQEQFPIEHMIWNRNYDGLDRPPIHNGYKINFIHGHDSRDQSHENIFNVDNYLGKSRDFHQGIYNVLYQYNKPTAELVLEDTQPMQNPQDYLSRCVANGQQNGMLIVLKNGAKLTKEMFAKVGDVNYKTIHPETHAVLTQAYLMYCIENGLQIGVIKALNQGAKLTVRMCRLLSDDAYIKNNPKTIAALRSYLRALKQQGPAGTSPVVGTSSSPVVGTISSPVVGTSSSSVVEPSENVNMLDIPFGDGLFRDLGLSHAKIQQLRREQASNVVIQNAFKVIEEADKGFQHDIQYLTDFIHSRRDQKMIREDDVIKMIDEDKSILSINRHLFGTGQNPKTWCVQRLLDEKILEKAKVMIQCHPELMSGRLPKPLKEYKSREVSVLKTALIYCALAKDEKNFLMRNIKGAYRLELNSAQKSAVRSMHIVRGLDTQYLYAPLNSYVLRATQIEKLNSGDKVMMGDCSGYVTNVLKKLFGKEYPRLFTYDLACFHDYKMRRKQNLSVKDQGPIVSRSGEHSALTSKEIGNADYWHSNYQREFDYLDSRLKTVSDMKNIRPGDLILWRNKSTVDGRGSNGVNGHIGVVLSADPAHNIVSLMENTAGSAYGLGIKKVSIVSDSTTTRILRPKI